jgi:transcriptional regulator with XRE-family HTH domain
MSEHISTIQELSLPDLIRRQREAKKLKKRELAHKVGVSESYISRLENGDIGSPKRNKEYFLEQTALVLEIPVPILLEAERLWNLRFQGDLLARLSAVDPKLTGELQIKEVLAQGCALLRQYLPHV